MSDNPLTFKEYCLSRNRVTLPSAEEAYEGGLAQGQAERDQLKVELEELGLAFGKSIRRNTELTGMLREILGGQPDPYGYGAAYNVLSDPLRERARALLDKYEEAKP